MSDSVKFIFKTLLRVPVIIVASYLVFNIFAFSLTYFRLLGVSYVVMQTAVENNYIPEAENNSLTAYLDSLQTQILEDTALVLEDEENPGIPPATERRQYGSEVTVGVTGNYKFIWPLTPRDQTANEGEGFSGLSGNSFSGYANESTLESRREANISDNNITIVYTVPGLKYYPDLD